MKSEKLNFWINVNKELKKQNKTQVELCKDCGLSLNSIRNRISVNSIPNIIDAHKIARFLNVSLEYLITGEDSGNTGDIYKEKYDGLKNAVYAALENN